MTKPKKIMVGIPFSGGMSARFHLSLINLTHGLAQDRYAVEINYEEGTLLSTQRNRISKAAMEGGFDLLFIDSDMVFSAADGRRLLSNDKDIIGGLYYSRKPDHWPLVFGEDLTETEHCFRSMGYADIPDKPFLCKGLGTGFLLIRNEALKKVWGLHERPFNFMELSNGNQYGEDLSFFRRCNLLGLEVWCDPRGDIGHVSERIVYKYHHVRHHRKDYHYCNSIPGWMTVREQDWLYNKAKVMDSIVEIGCWKGKSTHALCSGAKGMVTAVDHFKGGNSEIERKVHHRDAKNAEAEFMKYVGSRFSNLELIVSDSLSAAKSMTDRKFEMVFIDGSHDDKQVTLDLQAWEPKATKLISGHDYTNMEPVQKAVNDYFGQDNVRTFDSIWFVEK